MILLRPCFRLVFEPEHHVAPIITVPVQLLMSAVQTTFRSIDFSMPLRLNVLVGGGGYVDV